jgi:sRNA-binding carbon storage regulator CsrA
MVYLYFCRACEQNRHKDCELGKPSRPGTYGGTKCKCGCGGDPNWGKSPISFKQLNDKVCQILNVEKEQPKILINIPKDISAEIEKIKKRILKDTKKIEKLQNECLHPNVNVKYHGSTGNYDPHNDGYTPEYHCPICSKTWYGPKE